MSELKHEYGDSNDSSFDQSIDRNFWIIVHFPFSDPGKEFEIISKSDLAPESYEMLERGTIVKIRYGNAKVEGVTITVSDDLENLKKNYNSIVDEYNKECRQNEFIQRSRRHFEKLKSRNHKVRQVIKVMDKETQTPKDNNETARKFEHSELKRQYQELQTKSNRMFLELKDIKNGLQDMIMKIDDLVENIDGAGSTRLATNGLNEDDDDSSKENSLEKMIIIGEGGTKITRKLYNQIKWASYSSATRKLLVSLFPRHVLASHSLTGKPSPAFLQSNKQTKMRLNPTIISDIIEIVSKKSLVSESLVRNAITTKCADENKMHKKKLLKKHSMESELDDPKKIKIMRKI